MACYQYEVEFEVIKGICGPGSVTRLVPVAYDDVDDDVPESEVKKWAINDAKKIMAQRTERGYPPPKFIDIHYA